VHARHQFVRPATAAFYVPDPASVSLFLQTVISEPAVGVDHRTFDNRLLDEAKQACRRNIGNSPQANMSDPDQTRPNWGLVLHPQTLSRQVVLSAYPHSTYFYAACLPPAIIVEPESPCTREGQETEGFERVQNQESGLDLTMGFVDMFLKLGSELGARLFGRPGSGPTRHWGRGENFITIGTLEGDRCARTWSGHDECRHLVPYLRMAMVRAILHVHRTLGAESPLPSELQ
jgi:hypothetical protein